MWHGIANEDDRARISDLCLESELGCPWDEALEALGDPFDVDLLDGREEEIRTLVSDEADPQPVLMQLHSGVHTILTPFHAIVLLGIRDTPEGELVFYLDPLTGEIEEDSTGMFWRRWDEAGARACTIRP